MTFLETLQKKSEEFDNLTLTDNGAVALKTTGNKTLDLFGSCGAMRHWNEKEIVTAFKESYKENPLYAMKLLFYARDIRGGLGERDVVRTWLRWLGNNEPEVVLKNMELIPYFGRWDDLYCLVGTKVEKQMFSFMAKQIVEDFHNMKAGKPISLLAKWLKKENTSSKKTRELGLKTANAFNISVRDYRKLRTTLNKYLDTVEIKMSDNEWEDIKYSSVPAKAMLNYRNAFANHDRERFLQYKADVAKGVEKVNAGTLYPYDLIEKYLEYSNLANVVDDIVEEQWKALPNYVEDGRNVLIMADVSASMYGRPMATSVGLAIYFAQRNKGFYHGKFMEFSEFPSFVDISEEKTLLSSVKRALKGNWGFNTDIELAMQTILDVYKETGSAEDIPEALVVITDMQFDNCVEGSRNKTLFDNIKMLYELMGVKMPNVVFWNVNSPRNTFQVNSNQKDVQMYSGQAVSTFKNVINGISCTPLEAMMRTLDDERYSRVKI